MLFNFNDLGTFLPEESVQWAGFGAPLLLNLNRLTEDELTPESTVLEATAKLLQAIATLCNAINQERAGQTPPLPPIVLISRLIKMSSNGNPIYEYKFEVEVDAAITLSSVINPLPEPTLP